MVLSDIPANRSLLDSLGAEHVALFETGSSEDLERALLETIRGFDSRADHALRLAQENRERFDSEVAVKELLDLLERLLPPQ